MASEVNKVALLTGASRGIGAAIAVRLAADGFAIVLNFTSNAARAQSLADGIRKSGGKAHPVQADVRDPQAVKRMFDETDVAFGGIGVLVNNAGTMRLAPLAESNDALIESQLSANL